MRDIMIRRANDAYIFLEVIDQLEPASVLDVGMFMKRAGFVARQVMDKELPRGIRLDGVDFFPEVSLPIWQGIYDHVFSCEILAGAECGMDDTTSEGEVVGAENVRSDGDAVVVGNTWPNGDTQYMGNPVSAGTARSLDGSLLAHYDLAVLLGSAPLREQCPILLDCVIAMAGFLLTDETPEKWEESGAGILTRKLDVDGDTYYLLVKR